MAYSERFDRAFHLAHELHRDQRRKGAEIPYITHLMSVAALVAEYGGTEDQAIAGLLHDAVEDQGGMAVLGRIRDEFGDSVAGMIEACTDAHESPKPPWEERKRAHVDRMKDGPQGALLVIAADKVHNLRAMTADYRAVGDALWNRFKRGRPDILWYYRAMAAELRALSPHRIHDELDTMIDAFEQLTSNGQ